MTLEEIQFNLNSENPQLRMRGLTALRQVEPEVAAPILLAQAADPEMIVRSFVMMGLGYKRSDAGFAKLVEVMEDDADSNIRAEAAGALAKFGPVAVPYLVRHFHQDQHWLSRMTVVLALPDLCCPQEFLEVATIAANSTEAAVRSSALEQLPMLLETPYAEEALVVLLNHVSDPVWSVRCNVVLGLRMFDDDRAREALLLLRNDEDHRVVAATFEGLM
ncbi:MAG: HEAT repeat domain-containing protein [Alkalinema sp. FL-bin-369]|nr:HEAT repeat domain-containing protein [Leptolyngbyaceae cyanobacterium LF-bin-369]